MYWKKKFGMCVCVCVCHSGGSAPQNVLGGGRVVSRCRATWKISLFCAHLRSVSFVFDIYVGRAYSPHSWSTVFIFG
jgi:hypothetical protein